MTTNHDNLPALAIAMEALNTICNIGETRDVIVASNALAAIAAQGGQAEPHLDLSYVIRWLDAGCDPKSAADELRSYQAALVAAAQPKVDAPAVDDNWIEYPKAMLTRDDWDAATRKPKVAPADPMDWPLPCDVKVGCGTHGKGTALRGLVARMQRLSDALRESDDRTSTDFAKLMQKNAHDRAYEEWLVRVCPSGDVESVEGQWLSSSDYADLQEPEHAALPKAATSETVDDIVTALYRRFKDWSQRGFGPDDVTWCEVKADVQKLIALDVAARQAKPLSESQIEDIWNGLPGLEIVNGLRPHEYQKACRIAFARAILASQEKQA